MLLNSAKTLGVIIISRYLIATTSYRVMGLLKCHREFIDTIMFLVVVGDGVSTYRFSIRKHTFFMVYWGDKNIKKPNSKLARSQSLSELGIRDGKSVTTRILAAVNFSCSSIFTYEK